MLNLVTSAYAQEHGPTQGPAEAAVAQEVQESVGHPEAAHGAFPPFDPVTYGSQLFWLAIAFGLLYFVMSRVALPRIGTILEERNDRIADDLAEAERLKRETDEAMAHYEAALAEARQRAHAMAQGSREEAKAETEAHRTRIEAALNERLAAADARIGQVKSRALADVDSIAREATETIVQTLLRTEVSPAEVTAAVDAAMSERR